MPKSRTVLTIPEYGTPAPVISQIAIELDATLAEAEARLRRVGERLQRLHALPSNPFEITREGIIAKGIAGVAALSPTLEIEIRPKFANSTADWRADLMFLALVTNYGHIDPIASISASPTRLTTFADLVARVIVRAIEQNHRSPLRVRRRQTIETFEFDGEMDADTLLNPGEDGWRQTTYLMTRDNEYWATIYAGAVMLLQHVRDVEIAARLRATVMRWGTPQSSPSHLRRRLPPRLSAWQTAYDLCFEVRRGASLDPSKGRHDTFEFTLNMWRTWETLIERALVMTFGASHVSVQKDVKLGTVQRIGGPTPITVTPDAFVHKMNGVVIDSKYKGRWDRPSEGISAEDRYEAIAFMLAKNADKALLLYPSVSGKRVDDPPEVVQREMLPTGRLIAARLGLAEISSPSGLMTFAHSVRNAVGAAFHAEEVPIAATETTAPPS